MREIKFRAWDIEDGEFIYFDLYSVVGLRPEELDNAMQYAGLKDKNGVEIYEGDIVEYMHEVYVVEFRYGGFVLSRPTQRRKICHGLSVANMHSGVILIGNIYKNPELVEKSND